MKYLYIFLTIIYCMMEDAQGSYSHEEEFRGLHVSMGNVETESNGRRDRQEPVTMRSLQREVQSYREDNEIL
jgi:hypothetical protein